MEQKTKTTTTTTFPSSEFKALIFNFLRKWDRGINTFDDEDTRKMIKNKCNRSMNIIVSLQNKSIEKAINSVFDEVEQGKVLLDIQNKKWYKDLDMVYHDLQYMLFIIDSLYELKNRKSYDNVQLRFELSKLKEQLK